MTEPEAALESIDEILQCPVCHDTFNCPCVLPCRHALCFGCMIQLQSDTCPLCRDPFRHFSPESQNLQLAEMSKLRLKVTDDTIEAKNTYQAFVGMNDLIREYLTEKTISWTSVPIQRARTIVYETGSTWFNSVLVEHHDILTERNDIQRAEADIQRRKEALLGRRTNMQQMLLTQNIIVGSLKRRVLPDTSAVPSSNIV